jgi:hypothetical protein
MHGTALSWELCQRVEALNFWQLSRSSGRSTPISHGLSSEGVQGSAGNQMALKVEGVVGGGMYRDKALGGSWRLEPLHFALALAEGLVGNLGPVVLVNPLFMIGAQANLLERSTIGRAPETVGQLSLLQPRTRTLNGTLHELFTLQYSTMSASNVQPVLLAAAARAAPRFLVLS